MNGHSKETLEVVRAAMALAERDVDLGLVTIEEIASIPRTRFAAVERKQAVALLKAEGKSNRQIARELDIDHKTVAADLGENSPKNGENSPSDDDSSLVAELIADKAPFNKGRAPCDEECKEIKKQFLIRADIAARGATYTGPVDEEIRRAAMATALAWSDLSKRL